MNKHEANKLAMFDAVISFMETSSSKYADIPVIGETVANFSSMVNEIKAMDFEFMRATKSETVEKRVKEEALLNNVVKLANVLFVLGVKTKNTELMVKNKVSKSSLDVMREQLMINKSREILAFGTTNLEALVNYGVTQDTLNSVQSSIDDFQAAIDKKSEVHADSVALRADLKTKFQDATTLLYDELDPLMELYEESNTVFFDGYTTARLIRDVGIRKEEEVSTTIQN